MSYLDIKIVDAVLSNLPEFQTCKRSQMKELPWLKMIQTVLNNLPEFKIIEVAIINLLTFIDESF